LASDDNRKEASAYLDTNVLVNWMLLYRKGRKTRRIAEKRAKECMRLLDDILRGRYSCRFLVSAYAISELSQSARDNLIALKIMRDGQSLVWFNQLKKRYRLKNWEQADIRESLRSFSRFLSKKGFMEFDAVVDYDEVHRLSLKYGLETHDAIHLCVARHGADYLITTDPDLLEVKSQIKEIHVIRRATLRTITGLRKSRVMPR